jgi:hypothetical protein
VESRWIIKCDASSVTAAARAAVRILCLDRAVRFQVQLLVNGDCTDVDLQTDAAHAALRSLEISAITPAARSL